MRHAPRRMGRLPRTAQPYYASAVFWFYDGQSDCSPHRPFGNTIRYRRSFQLHIPR